MEAIKILLVEDELIVAMDMAERLKQSGYDICGIADNAVDAMDLFKKHMPDLVLLDITIRGDKTGLDVAHAITTLRPTPFIYVTAHSDALTVQKAKNTFPAAYLLKPFNTNSLLVSIELALHNFAYSRNTATVQEVIGSNEDDSFYLKEDHVFIKDGYTFIKVYLHEVLYLVSEDNYVRVVTTSKSILVRTTLSRACEKLHQTYFVRVHRSYCINTNHITAFTENEVMIGEKSIPISRSNKEELMRIFKFG